MSIRPILLALSVLALAGCATQDFVTMKDPQTGEQVLCGPYDPGQATNIPRYFGLVGGEPCESHYRKKGFYEVKRGPTP